MNSNIGAERDIRETIFLILPATPPALKSPWDFFLAIQISIDKVAKTVYIPLIPVDFLFELTQGPALPAQTRSAAVSSLAEDARKVSGFVGVA